ncbi:hypothetical protein AA986_05675 [Enterococcus cecorum]|nr:hypothetical protein AA986_05675 [Enterococcus cecorum]
MSWVAQLQVAKIQIGRKVRKVKDFSIQDGLDAPELPSEHRLPKDVKQLGQTRISQYLAVERCGYKQEHPSLQAKNQRYIMIFTYKKSKTSKSLIFFYINRMKIVYKIC